MSYTALYRKFRPQDFEDVKGQDHIVTALKIRSKPIGWGMPISLPGREEPVKRRWQRSWQRQSTVSIRWMAVPAMNVRPVNVSRKAAA